MIDRKQLLADLRGEVVRLEGDLREQVGSVEVRLTIISGWTGRRIALAAAVIGVLLVAACLLTSTWSQFAATPVPRDWAGEPLHLTTDRQAEQCVVDPHAGPPRSVTVPARPPRSALKIVGMRIDPWFPGNATIACTGPVQATSGPILALYPLSEREPWVILPGAVLLGAGWGVLPPAP